MDIIKRFFNHFTTITTGTVIVCAINMIINNIDVWEADILWHILIVGASTGIITALSFTDRKISKIQSIVRYIIHYILINVCVLFLGYTFGWYSLSFKGCLLMIGSIFMVYVFVFIITYVNEKKVANEINKALSNINDD